VTFEAPATGGAVVVDMASSASEAAGLELVEDDELPPQALTPKAIRISAASEMRVIVVIDQVQHSRTVGQSISINDCRQRADRLSCWQ